MIYLQLLLSFVQIGLFSFGGGYACMPLIQQQAVTARGWITMDTFADLFSISEMTPGPIAINAATFVGMQVAGVPGALLATLGYCIAPCILVSTLAWLYKRYGDLALVKGVLSGIRPAVVGLIASAGLTIFVTALWPAGFSLATALEIDLKGLFVFAAALFVLRRWKASPILVIASSGALGIIFYLIAG